MSAPPAGESPVPSSHRTTVLLDAASIQRALTRIAHEIAERNEESTSVVLLGIQADHAFAMMVEPLSANRTVEHLRLFFVGEEAARKDVYAASRHAVLSAWRVVFAEDIAAVEGMQAGRQSPGFQGGVFSPEMDQPTHYFHQWMARKIVAASEQA